MFIRSFNFLFILIVLLLALPPGCSKGNTEKEKNKEKSEKVTEVSEAEVRDFFDELGVIVQRDLWKDYLALHSEEKRSKFLKEFSFALFAFVLKKLEKKYKGQQKMEEVKKYLQKYTKGLGYDPKDKDMEKASFEEQKEFFQYTMEFSKKEELGLKKLIKALSQGKIQNIKKGRNAAVVIYKTKFQNKEGNKSIYLMKIDGKWKIHLKEEVMKAVQPERELYFVKAGHFPLFEKAKGGAKKTKVRKIPKWYQALPSQRASERGIEPGDLVLGYIATDYSGVSLGVYMVLDIEEGKEGDGATVMRGDMRSFSKVPIALLHPIKKYTKGVKSLSPGQVVVSTKGMDEIGRVSKVENGDIFVNVISGFNKVEEVKPEAVIPLPKEGYALRYVLFKDGKYYVKLGFCFAESQGKIWVTEGTSEKVIDKSNVRFIKDLGQKFQPGETVYDFQINDLEKVKIKKVLHRDMIYLTSEDSPKFPTAFYDIVKENPFED